MIGAVIAWLAQAAVPAPPPPDPAFARMVALFDEACLQAFPIDAALDRLMAAKGARALTPDEVKVTLVDDPGRGWVLADGDHHMQIMLELPPYHACSVRRDVAAQPVDPAPFRTLTDGYERAHPGFAAGPVLERDIGALHVHGTTDVRALPAGGAEMLMIIDQHAIDPASHVATGGLIEYRLVHQIANPDAH